MPDARNIVSELLADTKVMQLSTSAEGVPWICTVNLAADDQLNLYWMSMKTRRHSKEITTNPKVAIAVVKDPNVKQGIQMTGQALEVPRDELEQAHAIYAKRAGDKPERLEEAKSGTPDSRTYYRFTPDEIILWDEVNFPDNPRQSVTP